MSLRAQPVLDRLVRLGYLAKGLIYTLIGVLALRVGIGMRGGSLTDPAGVLMTLLRKPFGALLLTLIAVGIISYSLYYIVEAIADLRHKGGGVKGWGGRSLTIIKAVAYGSIGVQALLLVVRNRGTSKDTEDTARTVMLYPLGDVVLALIGAGIVVYAIAQLRTAWRGDVDDDMDVSRVRREAAWLVPVGRFGTVARSVILALMGGTLTFAALHEHPTDVNTFSEALATIASLNPWLLAMIGAGLFCFGLYEGCRARYVKLAPTQTP
ncbi:MAG TPA: DUF1206 domain-containing protein [Vicinamibacterales bacterium]|jgi:hypothetical protein